jgi:hypothetical protein
MRKRGPLEGLGDRGHELRVTVPAAAKAGSNRIVNNRSST